MHKFPDTRRVQAHPETLINIIADEAVLLNLANEQYYGLDEVGTSMWQALTKSDSIQEAFLRLQEQYDVADDVLQKDLYALLDQLCTNGLVEVHGA